MKTFAVQVCRTLLPQLTFMTIVMLFCISCMPAAQAAPFYTLNKKEADSEIRRICKKHPDFFERLAAIAELRVGTPYVLGPLGEDDKRGPVFQTKTVDCTVMVLTSLALAYGENYDGAREMMTKLNYYDPPVYGKKTVSYENRIHFTYDRLHTNPYFRDISYKIIPEKELKTVSITLNRKSDGTKLLPVQWEKSVKARYIPTGKINAKMMASLPPERIVGVGFVREKAFSLGVVVSHEGFIIDGKYLIHADSIAKKVVKTDFLDYMKKNGDYFDGVIISAFRPGKIN